MRAVRNVEIGQRFFHEMRARFGICPAPRCPTHGSIKRNDTLDFAGLIQVIGGPFEAGVTVRHGSQDGDIAARRTSGNAKALWIKMEPSGVRGSQRMAAFTS